MEVQQKSNFSKLPRALIAQYLVAQMEQGSQALTLTLRARPTPPSGLAPAGVLRDRQAEKRKALANATQTALASAGSERKHDWVALKKGDATEVYQKVAKQGQLFVVPRLRGAAVPTADSRKARMAAMARWYKDTHAGKSHLVAATSAKAEELSPTKRYMRRGEFALMPGSYRAYNAAELLAAVREAHSKLVKWTEIQKNYDDGKTRVPPAAIKGILYPKDKAEAKIKALEEGGLKELGASSPARM